MPFDQDEFKLLPISKEYLPKVWPVAITLLSKVKDYWGKQMTFDFAYNEILEGRMQLWFVTHDVEFVCAMITAIRFYDGVKSLQSVCIGGSRLDAIMPHLEYIEIWARKHGASQCDFTGRKEWISILKRYGYEQTAIVMTKQLPEIKEH